MGRSVNPLRDLESLRAIRKIIREFRPDIVHTHAAKAGALGRIAARLEGVPVVVHTYHGHVFDHYFSPWKSQLIKRVERFLARKSTAIVVISSRQFDDITVRFAIAPAPKVHVIPLGFDLGAFQIEKEERRKVFREKYTLQETECAIGLIGRFAPVKNHLHFLRAFARIKQSQPHARAFLIGDGELRALLEAECDSLGLTRTSATEKADVVFTSWVQPVSHMMSGLDLVVLTSLNEGTPVSLIEAQAAGVAVISTDVGGVRDCVSSDRSGIIIPSEDENALVQAIMKLASDAALRNEYGAFGAKFVEDKFRHTRLVSDMHALYHGLLS